MKKLKKNILILIIALFVITVAIIWIADAPNRKTKAFLARYEITNLTTLGFQKVFALNDKGQILGIDKQDRIVTWDKQNGLTVLNIPKEARCFPEVFNNFGQITGCFFTPSGKYDVFIWDTQSGLVELGTLGELSSGATAINDLGNVIGSTIDPNGRSHPFFWDPNAGMTDLHLFINNQDRIEQALDIDNAGRVVGYTSDASDGWDPYAIIWDKKSGFVRLPTPHDAASVASCISPDGKVAGELQVNGHLIIWDSSNNYRDLGSLRRNARHWPKSINDAGQIVGSSFHLGILSAHWFAFFWSEETGFVVLEKLGASQGKLTLPKLPWLSSSDSNDLQVLDINNRGQILKVTFDANDQCHAILMTPKKTPKE